jgi:hypothetical protein
MTKYLNTYENTTLNNIILERFKTQNFTYKQEEYNDLLLKAKKNIINDKTTELISDIPVIYMNQTELFGEYLKKKQPFILRGFVDKTILEQHSFDNYIEKYGHHNVRYFNKNKNSSCKKLEHMKNNKDDEYVFNSGLLPSIYPEIVNSLNLDRIHNLLNNKKNLFVYHSQLFLGNSITFGKKPSLLDLMHSAPNSNMFIMLEGEKKWTMIDPRFSNLMNIDLNTHCQRFMLNNDNPLLEYLPKKIGIVKEGDLLFVPYLYWHAVESITKETVSIANRMIDTKTKEKYIMNVLRNNNDECKEYEFKKFCDFFKKSDRTKFVRNIYFKDEDDYYNSLLNVEKFSNVKN